MLWISVFAKRINGGTTFQNALKVKLSGILSNIAYFIDYTTSYIPRSFFSFRFFAFNLISLAFLLSGSRLKARSK